MVDKRKSVLPGEQVKCAQGLIVKEGVGCGARLVVGGDLKIEGDVGEGAIIIVGQQTAPYWFVQNREDCLAVELDSGSGHPEGKRQVLEILGQVANGVMIMMGNVNMTVKGRIGDACVIRVNAGSISVNDVGSDVVMKINCGNIQISETLNKNSRVVCDRGHLNIGAMGESSVVEVNVGNVCVAKREPSAQIHVKKRVVAVAPVLSSGVTLYGRKDQERKALMDQTKHRVDVSLACCSIL